MLLPVSLGAWRIYVEPQLADVIVYGYADMESCVAVVSGKVYEIRYFIGEYVDVVAESSDYFCIPADTIFTLSASAPTVLSFPPADVSISPSLFYSVGWKDLGRRTMVFIDKSTYFIVGLSLLVLLVAGSAFLLRSSYWPKKRIDVHSNEGAVIDYIAVNPGCTQKDISKALGLEKYQVSRILSRLEQQGVVIRVKRGISKQIYLRKQLQ